MVNYRRNFVPGGTYFFTVNLAERSERLLIGHIELLRTTFRAVRRDHPFSIDAIVVLLDHLHAVWTLPQNDSDYALRWRLIKTNFSRSLALGEPGRANSAAYCAGRNDGDTFDGLRFANPPYSPALQYLHMYIIDTCLID